MGYGSLQRGPLEMNESPRLAWARYSSQGGVGGDLGGDGEDGNGSHRGPLGIDRIESVAEDQPGIDSRGRSGQVESPQGRGPIVGQGFQEIDQALEIREAAGILYSVTHHQQVSLRGAKGWPEIAASPVRVGS